MVGLANGTPWISHAFKVIILAITYYDLLQILLSLYGNCILLLFLDDNVARMQGFVKLFIHQIMKLTHVHGVELYVKVDQVTLEVFPADIAWVELRQ